MKINKKTYDKSYITVQIETPIQNIETLNKPMFKLKLRSKHLKNFDLLNKDLETIKEPIRIESIHFYTHVFVIIICFGVFIIIEILYKCKPRIRSIISRTDPPQETGIELINPLRNEDVSKA